MMHSVDLNRHIICHISNIDFYLHISVVKNFSIRPLLFGQPFIDFTGLDKFSLLIFKSNVALLPATDDISEICRILFVQHPLGAVPAADEGHLAFIVVNQFCITLVEADDVIRRQLRVNILLCLRFVSILPGLREIGIFLTHSACRTAGFTPRIAVSSNDILCCEALVASGMGIGLERRRTAGDGITAYLDVVDFHEEYVVCVYYREAAAYGNVASFLQFLREKALR